jgi:hypothetical protein
MRLLELRPGFAKTCLTVEDRHLDNVGTLQGGAIFTLADFVFDREHSGSGNHGAICQAATNETPVILRVQANAISLIAAMTVYDK